MIRIWCCPVSVFKLTNRINVKYVFKRSGGNFSFHFFSRLLRLNFAIICFISIIFLLFNRNSNPNKSIVAKFPNFSHYSTYGDYTVIGGFTDLIEYRNCPNMQSPRLHRYSISDGNRVYF